MDHSGPIFVGGTGRGTTITARILGAHSRLHMVPIEVRLLVDPGGLCDLVAGKTDFERFSAKLTGTWWHRQLRDGSTRGLHKILDEESLKEALRELQDSPTHDAPPARRFVHRILDPVAASSGASRWVEMTPPNVFHATELLKIFPDMKLIHVARDGRNVACSVSPLGWGPNDPFSALEWWGDRMLQAHRVAEGLNSDQLLEIRMEELTSRTSGIIQQLFDFVGESPDQSVQHFLEKGIRAERALVERWKTDLAERARKDFERHYFEVVNRLAWEGVPTERWGLHSNARPTP